MTALVAAFLTPLRVEEIDAERWRLLEPLHYRSSLVGDVIVPTGFPTDFCSIPKLTPALYALLKSRGRKAGVVHDYLYREALYPRATCDEIFREALIVLGEPAGVVALMYAGVRLGGESSYAGGPDPREDAVTGAPVEA